MVRTASSAQSILFVSAIVLATAGGCTNTDEAGVRESVNQIWNLGNLEQIDARYSEAMARELKEQVESTRSFYPDLNMTVETLVVEGDVYFFRWTVTGTHRKYAKKVELRGVTHGRLEGGKIVDEQIVYDRLEEADQLGFMIRSPSEL